MYPRASILLALAPLLGAACATEGAPDDVPAQSMSAATSTYVGCRRSPGECRASCPDARFLFRDPDARCPGAGDAPYDTGACTCGEDATPPERPDGAFVGCRPSAGECVMSCPTRRAAYVEGLPECPGPGDPPHVRGACFCR